VIGQPNFSSGANRPSINGRFSIGCAGADFCQNAARCSRLMGVDNETAAQGSGTESSSIGIVISSVLGKTRSTNCVFSSNVPLVIL
jgi:hypothetical protein